MRDGHPRTEKGHRPVILTVSKQKGLIQTQNRKQQSIKYQLVAYIVADSTSFIEQST